MRTLALLAAVAIGAAVSGPALAAVSCPDREPAPITAVAANSLKCQDTIVKEGRKFVKKQMKAFAKCLLKDDPNCPDIKNLDKIIKAGQKGAEKIADKCGTTEIAGLTSSYVGEDAAVLASCVLSQHNAFATVLAIANTGVYNEDNPLLNDDSNKDRKKCTKTVSNETTKYVNKAHKAVTQCISKQIKDQTAADLVDTCVGRYNGGAFDPPTDTKTAAKLTDLATKTEDNIQKKCGSTLTLGYVPYMYACAGAQTAGDLKACAICEGWDMVVTMLEQQYAEDGQFVANGPGALENAIGLSAGTVSGKFLIESGTYEEGVVITSPDLEIAGCGGAVNDRPILTPPAVSPPARGITAVDVDGLSFQSLDLRDWTSDGIFVSGAEGVSFRDILGDGGSDATVFGSGSVYALFPVQSNNVLVEGCRVESVHDAGIYVGQSSNIVVAHNIVVDNTAGIEIENSRNARVFNNFGTGNTGGLLVFKLDGPALQTDIGCHEVHHNFMQENNRLNNGPGSVGLIPPGTGLIILTNDFSLFDYNVIRDNKTFGILIADQIALNAIINPDPFDPPSPDPDVEANYFRNNVAINNALDADPFAMGFENDALFLAIGGGPDNCSSNNLFSLPSNFSALVSCMPPPQSLPFASCPYPSVL